MERENSTILRETFTPSPREPEQSLTLVYRHFVSVNLVSSYGGFNFAENATHSPIQHAGFRKVKILAGGLTKLNETL